MSFVVLQCGYLPVSEEGVLFHTWLFISHMLTLKPSFLSAHPIPAVMKTFL